MSSKQCTKCASNALSEHKFMMYIADVMLIPSDLQASFVNDNS
jgi:hypothetical protein